MTIKLKQQRPKCQFCNEEAKVWEPFLGMVCKFSSENGFCRKDGKICPQCNELVGKLKPIYFIGGPMVCFNCRNKEIGDMFD